MAADLLVLRSARNAYLLVLLALVGTSTYQFATTGGITPAVALLWIVAAGGFYLSKWYYRRSGSEEAIDGDGNDGDTAE